MIRYIFILSIFICSSCANNKKIYKVGFYNVENLFDTIDGPNIDEEFLPNSKLNWNQVKYNEKIAHINQVIQSLDYPIILGLCEIENIKVLKDLIFSSATLKKSYGIVHHDSPDKRGIDASFIYNKDVLKLLSSGKLHVQLDEKNLKPTRDIVWAKFSSKKDTILTLVNHWPSRRGGTEKSEHKRLKAAQTAKTFIDSVLKQNPLSKIILMGDLNDYPENKAPLLIKESLNQMITKNSGNYGGTHCYRNHWGVLDHIFVSDDFAVPASGKINEFDYLFTQYKGKTVPFRTFGGGKYLGGYSDHLPVSIEIEMK